MRITNNMMANTLRSNLFRNMTNLNKLQNQLSTGKRISKPSDDPVNISYSLRLRNNLVENEQYSANVNDAQSFLEATDSALGEAGDALQRIRELAVKGANSTNSTESLEAIRREVAGLREHIQSIANTEFAGKYIFSGTLTNKPAYVGVPGTWQGNDSAINFEIGVGVKLQVNQTADKLFGDNASNVFQSLANLEADLTASNFTSVSSRIGEVDNWLDKVNNGRADVGARVNRLEFTKNRLEETKLNFTDLLSKNEDADMGQIITELTEKENVYKASLGAGARIVQPSLIDFMR